MYQTSVFNIKINLLFNSPLAAAADSVRLRRFGGAAGRLSRGVSLGNIVLGGGGSSGPSSPRPAQRSATAAIPLPPSQSPPVRESGGATGSGEQSPASDSFDTLKVSLAEFVINSE